MSPLDLAALLNRAAAAIETPADLNAAEKLHVIQDLTTQADLIDPPADSFKSLPPPADPRYPAANAVLRPAAGQAAHFLPISWHRRARPKGASGLDAGYSVLLQSGSHVIGEVMGLEGVLRTDDKANPTREEIAEGIKIACNSHAGLVEVLESASDRFAILAANNYPQAEGWLSDARAALAKAKGEA